MKEMYIFTADEIEAIQENLYEIFDTATDKDAPYFVTNRITSYLNRIHDILSEDESLVDGWDEHTGNNKKKVDEDKEKDVGCWIYGRKETLSKLVKDCFEANLAFEIKKKIEELEKQLNELRDAEKTKGDIHNVDKLVERLTNELDDTDQMLFDHEKRLNNVEEDMEKLEKEVKETFVPVRPSFVSSTIERLDKLEKAVMDIPKTMGKITEKMMKANMGDKDKDLKSFSMNLYWNYDDSEEDEDDN